MEITFRFKYTKKLLKYLTHFFWEFPKYWTMSEEMQEKYRSTPFSKVLKIMEGVKNGIYIRDLYGASMYVDALILSYTTCTENIWQIVYSKKLNMIDLYYSGSRHGLFSLLRDFAIPLANGILVVETNNLGEPVRPLTTRPLSFGEIIYYKTSTPKEWGLPWYYNKRGGEDLFINVLTGLRVTTKDLQNGVLR